MKRDALITPQVAIQNVCMHKPKPIPKNPSADADGFAWVSMSDVPSNARYNEAAGKLFAAIKLSQSGHALKISMAKFKKVTLVTAQRYALSAGLRIGVRIVGESGYLWKMSEAEIKAVEQKAERLRDHAPENRTQRQNAGRRKIAN